MSTPFWWKFDCLARKIIFHSPNIASVSLSVFIPLRKKYFFLLQIFFSFSFPCKEVLCFQSFMGTLFNFQDILAAIMCAWLDIRVGDFHLEPSRLIIMEFVSLCILFYISLDFFRDVLSTTNYPLCQVSLKWRWFAYMPLFLLFSFISFVERFLIFFF